MAQTVVYTRRRPHEEVSTIDYQLELTPTAEETESWLFLTGLSVTAELNTNFWVALIHSLRNSKKSLKAVDIAEMYLKIDELMPQLDDECSIIRAILASLEIFVPYDGGSWKPVRECRWDAPPFMRSSRALKSCYASALANTNIDIERLGVFFQDVLGLKDMTCEDITVELMIMTSAGGNDCDLERAQSLYAYIEDHLHIEAQERPMIKQVFLEDCLIYVPNATPRKWFQAGDCLWSSEVHIVGKVSINKAYPKLENFFVNCLGVERLSSGVIWDELQRLAIVPRANIVVADVKLLLLTLSDFIRRGDNVPLSVDVNSALIVPVRQSAGEIMMQSAASQFYIVDRTEPVAELGRLVPTLDFDLSEVCRLEPLLSQTGLGLRSLSKAVQDITEVCHDEARLVEDSSREIGPKASAIMRIAAMFNSPKCAESFNQLQTQLLDAETFETNDIRSKLTIDYDGETFEIKNTEPTIHLDDSDGHLRIYVPANKEAQAMCYKSVLPRRLARWLLSGHGGAEQQYPDEKLMRLLTLIVDVPSSLVDWILDVEGVPEMFFDLPQSPAGDVAHSDDAVEDVDTKCSNQVADMEGDGPPDHPPSSDKTSKGDIESLAETLQIKLSLQTPPATPRPNNPTTPTKQIGCLSRTPNLQTPPPTIVSTPQQCAADNGTSGCRYLCCMHCGNSPLKHQRDRSKSGRGRIRRPSWSGGRLGSRSASQTAHLSTPSPSHARSKSIG